VGYFKRTSELDKLAAENKYTFVEFNNRNENDPHTIIEGDQLVGVEYPSA
jgi:hypothetical protein